MNPLHVTLRTPTAILFDGDAESVRLKNDLGRMEILPEHATLVGTILYSKVYIRHKNTEEKFIIRQGSVSIAPGNLVRILANEAHKEDELSIKNMEDYLSYLAKQLGNNKLNDYQLKFLTQQRAALEEQLKESTPTN